MRSGTVDLLGPSSKFAVLAATTAKTIRTLEKGKIGQSERSVLKRAGDFLSGIIKGSQFAERKQTKALTDPQEELFTLDHAISALRMLEQVGDQNHPLTEIFEQLRDDIRSLYEGHSIDAERLLAMHSFFTALAQLFYQEIADRSVFATETKLP